VSAPLPFPYRRGSDLDAVLDDLIERVALRVVEHIRATTEDVRRDDDRLLTAGQAGEVLAISRSSLDRLVREGTLSIIKIGASNRYSSAEVQALIERSTLTLDP
jgi:excisionase family DNA binding protein